MGLVAPSQSNAGDLITAGAINNPINQLAAVINGNIDSTNILDGSVNTLKLTSGAVTTLKIADGAITAEKLATSAITLGYAQTLAIFNSASTTAVQITGLSVTVTIPAGGRRVKITGFTQALFNNTANARADFTIWDGPVGTGTQLSRVYGANGLGTGVWGGTVIAVVTPPAGTKTYNLGLQSGSGGGTATMQADATAPAFILVELI